MKWLTQWKSYRDQDLRNWSQLSNTIPIFASLCWLLPASLCASFIVSTADCPAHLEGNMALATPADLSIGAAFCQCLCLCPRKGLWLYLGMFLLYISPCCQGDDWPGLSLRSVPGGARYCDWSAHRNCAE